MPVQQQAIDRNHILSRIDDWKDRLRQLCDNIERWAEKIKDAKPVRQDIPQAREELMQKFGVEPGTLPAIAILHGKQRVSFVPMALWVIGANGRVNITTNSHRYILMDDSVAGESSKWIIVDISKRGQRSPLDQESLIRLVNDEDLFA